jgi:hypothetical protein
VLLAKIVGIVTRAVVSTAPSPVPVRAISERTPPPPPRRRYTPSGKSGYLVALKHLAPALSALSEEDYCAYLQQFSVLRKLRNK